MIAADHLWLLALAMILDAIVGDPRWFWARLPHPVVLIGTLIDTLDRRGNDARQTGTRRRAMGVLAIAAVTAIAAAVGFGLEWGFRTLPYGWIGTVVAASVLLAGRSLYDHVLAVARPLAAHDLAGARTALSHIVGRDTARLDEAGVARAAIETLAENFSDGVIAPALWFLVLGLPGIAAYKAISTANSMIGHRDERHAAFGWAAARLDDLVNLPASRLSGLLVALAAPGPRDRSNAFRAMTADAARHASPNAGWPEAAMAGALGIALGGPKTYGGAVANDAWLNPGGRKSAGATDIRHALRIYIGAAAILLLVVAVTGAVVAFA